MSTKTKKGVALIVGAGDATGGAIAKRFAKAGFQVVVTRRKIESLDNLSQEIMSMDGIVHPFGVDARREDDVVPFIEKIERDIGPIEVAVTMSGVMSVLEYMRRHRESFLKFGKCAVLVGSLWVERFLAQCVRENEALSFLPEQQRV